jgi:xylono-1,5-lactonase
MQLGESTTWVDEEHALYFVDGLQGKLLRYSESDGVREVYRYPGVIGFVVRRSSGGFMVSTDGKLCTLDPTRGVVKEVVCPEPHLRNSHFNDGKVDPRGRLWAGTLDRDCAIPVGSLYRIEKDLSWTAVDSGYLCPNGPAFSPDGRILYHSDSMRRTIYQFDFDLDAGAVFNRRIFVMFSDDDGLPDGMTVDRDGRLWVAHFGGARVTAFAPDGRVDVTIPVPAPNVTSCTFGGSNGTTLFISTARTWMNEAQLREAPLAGSLFAIEGLANGIPAFSFKG